MDPFSIRIDITSLKDLEALIPFLDKIGIDYDAPHRDERVSRDNDLNYQDVILSNINKKTRFGNILRSSPKILEYFEGVADVLSEGFDEEETDMSFDEYVKTFHPSLQKYFPEYE